MNKYLPTATRKYRHVAVQIEAVEETTPIEQKQRIRDYFKQYFEESFDIKVYWGSCHESRG